MSKQILFVDDETNVLQGLRRMLRPLRNEWELQFATDGQQALDVLDRSPCDVLVSDMRLQGLDGLGLLERVRTSHPGVVRIVLSGSADRDSMVAAVGPAHQYLGKPCNAETLRDTIDRALMLRLRIGSEAVVNLVSRVSSLPSVPSLYFDLKKELESPDGSPARVAEIIASDAAMTAKILQTVNSAFFGARREIANPLEAVRLLGFDLIQALTLSAGVFAHPADDRLTALTEQVWRHSLTTAAYAKAIARAEHADAHAVDMAITTGLLHDVGKLVLGSCIGDGYLTLCREAAGRGQPMWQLEQEEYGTSHAEIGAYLLSLWGLPDRIAEVVAFHHRPTELGSDGGIPLTAVHVANGLVHQESEDSPESALDAGYLERGGLMGRVEGWVKTCREARER